MQNLRWSVTGEESPLCELEGMPNWSDGTPPILGNTNLEFRQKRYPIDVAAVSNSLCLLVHPAQDGTYPNESFKEDPFLFLDLGFNATPEMALALMDAFPDSFSYEWLRGLGFEI